ncbi:MAG: alpha/beta hydrolase [Bacteroidales bacterium]|nr:alpha/beta hydrolase [Bacteroidales bacterium]
MKKLLSLLIASLILSSCVALVESRVNMHRFKSLLDSDYKGVLVEKVEYLDGLYYDLFLPQDLRSPKAGKLMLYVHGGSWNSGSREEGERWCRHFASMGYTAASMDYSLQKGRKTPSIDRMIEDIHSCVAHIAGKVPEWDVELEEMALCGFSAGATLIMLYGYREAEKWELPVSFMIQMSGPVTFDPDAWKSEVHHWVDIVLGLDGSPEGDAAFVAKMSGMSVSAAMVESGSAREIWEAISPVCQVTATAPPLLMAYGETDGVVPRLHKTLLMAALDSVGVHYDYVGYPNSGHTPVFDPDCHKRFIELADQYCEAYFGNE